MKRLILAALLLSSTPALAETKTVILAGGCFWSMEKDMDKLDGVVSTTSGYTGGKVANPTYEQVSSQTTGHLEAVKVEYDASKLTYTQVVEYYFRHIDPLDPVGQFCDKGPEYHTAVFYATPGEKAEAEKLKTGLEAELKQSFATELRPAAPFYAAEEYHQDYYKKNTLHYETYRFGCGRDARVKDIWGRN